MAMRVAWLKDLRLKDLAEVGGKNASLGEMIGALGAAGNDPRLLLALAEAELLCGNAREARKLARTALQRQPRDDGAFDVLASATVAIGDEALLRERLAVHLRTHEVLILSGGVSMGRFDFVPKVLAELGVQCLLHGIAQRPGKPMWFGTGEAGRAVFALPGNPVSTLVCLSRYVLPALYAAMRSTREASERIALAEALEWQPALTGFMPVAVSHDAWGRPWATPRPTNGSGDFAALAQTDGFVELPPGPASFNKGFVTRLYRW